MPCYAMQPLGQNLIRKDFTLYNLFKNATYCTSNLAKFYYCKKWCYKPTPSKEFLPSRFRKLSETT
jgi:hypothetical protein